MATPPVCTHAVAWHRPAGLDWRHAQANAAFEISAAAELLAEAAHPEADLIFGPVVDDTLGGEVRSHIRRIR